MENTLWEKLEQYDKSGNYIAMGDLLRDVVWKRNADAALYVLKCVSHGGMREGNNSDVVDLLEESKDYDSSDEESLVFRGLDKHMSKVANDGIDLQKPAIVSLTNSNFCEAIKGIITYGEDEQLDKATEIIAPLFEPLKKHYKKLNLGKGSDQVVHVICTSITEIAELLVSANKAKTSSGKKLLNGFIDGCLAPFEKAYSTWYMRLMGLIAPWPELKEIKATIAKLKKMI